MKWIELLQIQCNACCCWTISFSTPLIELTKWLRDQAHVLICRRHVPNTDIPRDIPNVFHWSRIHECFCRTWDDLFTPDKFYCLRVTSWNPSDNESSSRAKNRYIGENVRLISDIMMYTEENNMPAIALFVDFRKAFDTIEWDFMNNCLQKFNFGPDIQNWVKIYITMLPAAF